ncbi:hypothetical protein IE077_003944, partial [Cardiosporidium cionae]
YFFHRGLANLANAFSKLEIRHKSLFSHIADEVLYRGTIGQTLPQFQFDGRSLDQLANAFSKMGLHDPRIFFVLSELVKRNWKYAKHSSSSSHKLDSISLSNLLFAFGKTRLTCATSFFPQIIQHLLPQVEFLSTIGLHVVIKACVYLSIKHSNLYEIIMKQANKNMHLFPSLLLVAMMKNFSHVDAFKHSFIRKATKQCQINLAYFDAPLCCRLLLAF